MEDDVTREDAPCADGGLLGTAEGASVEEGALVGVEVAAVPEAAVEARWWRMRPASLFSLPRSNMVGLVGMD